MIYLMEYPNPRDCTDGCENDTYILKNIYVKYLHDNKNPKCVPLFLFWRLLYVEKNAILSIPYSQNSELLQLYSIFYNCNCSDNYLRDKR